MGEDERGGRVDAMNEWQKDTSSTLCPEEVVWLGTGKKIKKKV
jgi:hypothetical protein